jgi:hypothetical protein
MFDRTQTSDGARQGTLTGTVTAGGATSLTDSGASFDTFEDGLASMFVTKVAVLDGTVETVGITSNTGTVLTTASWPTTPAVGDTYHIGTVDFRLWLGGIDAGIAAQKRFCEVLFGFQPGTGTFEFGITDTEGTGSDIEDEDSFSVTEDVSAVTTALIFPNSRAFRVSPFVKALARNCHCSLDDIEIEYQLLRRML